MSVEFSHREGAVRLKTRFKGEDVNVEIVVNAPRSTSIYFS